MKCYAHGKINIFLDCGNMARVKKKQEKKWQKAIDLYNSLGCPEEFFNPTDIVLDRQGYHWILSDRSRGKTVNILLFGLCVFWCYGIRIEYIRQTDEQAAPSKLQTIWDVAILCGYVKKITNDNYNTITYDKGYWYLALTDSSGNIKKVHQDALMHKCSIQSESTLKSSYNSPLSDFIVYDECIAVDGNMLINEYVKFIDLIMTLNRMRTTTEIFMIANTLSSNSVYYREMLITDVIKSMKQGDNTEYINALGVHFTIHILSPSKSETRKKAISGYYASTNEEISGLTGSQVWSSKNFKHIPENDKAELIHTQYIETETKFYKLELIRNSNGLGVYVSDTVLENKEDYTIFSMYSEGLNIIFGVGNPRTNIWLLRSKDLWYYQNNEIGMDIVYYLKSYIAKKREMVY